jgi:hypothetical protein
MNAFENVNSFALFLVWFIPGFISITVYDLLIAGEKREFTKSIFQVIAFSTLNFVVLSWLILINYKCVTYENHLFCFVLSVALVFLIFPAIWSILWVWLIRQKWMAKKIVHPVKRPWDWFFGKKESVWVIVTLKDGRKIGGIYGGSSYVSSYPLPEQIYLEVIWKLDEYGSFLSPVEQTKGVIILGGDISTIEFFKGR